MFGGGEVCRVDAEVLWCAARVGGVAFDVVSGHRLFSGVCDAALEDDGGRIHRCGEATGVRGVIAEMQWCGVLEQVLSQCACGNGTPEFCGQQKCEYSAMSCEFEAALGDVMQAVGNVDAAGSRLGLDPLAV